MTTHRSSRAGWATLLLIPLLVAGCKKGHEASAGGEISHNWKPAPVQGVMGVPTATVTSAIETRLKGSPPTPIGAETWKHTKALYAGFNGASLWFNNDGLNKDRASALMRMLASADSDALALDRYPLTAVGQALNAVQSTKTPTADQIAEADVTLSAAYAAIGENMLTGQIPPAGLGQAWHVTPHDEHVDSALTLTLRADELEQGLDRMRPQDANYLALRKELEHYRDLVQKGGWQPIPAGRALKRGDSDSPERLQALRDRLAVEGSAPDSVPAAPAPVDTTAKKKVAAAERTGPGVYNRALADAVAKFQSHHGLAVTHVLDKETITAMNVPADYRLAQIAANLERYRWMPRSLGHRYLLVNVPEFMLQAYDSGQKQLEMKVIVGQEYEDKATPVFSDSMEYVVFRPYWNVTDAIAAKEMWPKVNADPSYLERGNYEVYNDHGKQRIRQLPGPKNALGLVKFLFPNDFNIYLHDTPNDELFKKDIRAFSHGCIRLEKPAELAQWVLGWSPEKVQDAMNGSNNRTITLPKKLPVYIAYFTTYVKNGELYFGNDLYDRDSKLVAEVKAGAQPSPEAVKAAATLREMAR